MQVTTEFNVWSDPEAARRVLVEEDVPCVLVPMDLTHRCAVDTGWLARLAASGPIGAALDSLTPAYRATYRKTLGREGIVLHDAVAVAEAINPGILRTEPFPIDVECSLGPSRGSTVVDRRPADAAADAEEPVSQGKVDVAVDTDYARLREFVLARLARG